MTITVTDPKTADFMRVSSLTDDVVVVDRYGHRATFETLEMYGHFVAGLTPAKRTLYDDIKHQWVVGTILHLDPA